MECGIYVTMACASICVSNGEKFIDLIIRRENFSLYINIQVTEFQTASAVLKYFYNKKGE